MCLHPTKLLPLLINTMSTDQCLTRAFHTSIILMGANGVPVNEGITVDQAGLMPFAMDGAQSNQSTARAKFGATGSGFSEAATQLRAHHTSCLHIPVMVANRPPLLVKVYFDSTGTVVIPVHYSHPTCGSEKIHLGDMSYNECRFIAVIPGSPYVPTPKAPTPSNRKPNRPIEEEKVIRITDPCLCKAIENIYLHQHG